MENHILQILYQGRGQVAWISIAGADPVLAGIHLIDEKFQTVTLINGNGNRALKALKDRGDVKGEEEQAIVSNPENFSVIPLKEIAAVELLS